MKTSHVEIMAPAGSLDSLHAAINAGADSVYLGIADFNMRATAARNFLFDDLEEIVGICHSQGVKVYVTVNTLMYNSDLEKMRRIIDELKRIGADSAICADMATILYANRNNVPVHISTQLSVSNIESVKFYSQFCERIVLARELSLVQIKELANMIADENVKGTSGKLVELEVFAHGAMCVAVSGRCAMSLFASGESANRGKCTQICRRRFKVTDIDTGQELEVDNNYVMSASDLCTIGMLDELVATGINVLKIEGRGRPPEYVDTVVRTYREALDSLQKGIYTEDKIGKWRKDLKTVFNRGQSDGLYHGLKFSEWAGCHGSKSEYEKVHIGHVENYFAKIQVALIRIKAKEKIHKGDQYMIIGDTTGIVRGNLEEMRLDDSNLESGFRKVDCAEQNDLVSIKLDTQVRLNDKFYVFRKRNSLVPRGKDSLIHLV